MSYQNTSKCRVCFDNLGVWPIFGDNEKPDLSSQVEMFGSILVEKDDNLPKHICDQCYKHLQGAITFRQTAKRTDIALKKWKKKNNLMEQSTVKANETGKVEKETFILSTTTDNCNEANVGKPSLDLVSVQYILEGSSEKIDSVHNENYTELFTDDDVDNHNDFKNEISMVSSNKKNVEQTLKITCKYCNMNFPAVADLEEHRETVEHKRNYVISFLPKQGKKKKSEAGKIRASSRRVTVNPKDKLCDICGRYFTHLHYPQHMHTVHNIVVELLKTECPLCKKMLNPDYLVTHVKKVHGDATELPPREKLECPICKKLLSKVFFPLHMKRHESDNKNFVCDQCGKKFHFESAFCTHRLIHTNELPHKCEYCPYRGRTRDLLNIHVRTHTGDYRYKCTLCKTRCLTKSNLNSHLKRHRGPVDFICDYCSKGCYTKLQLEAHISVIHFGVKKYVCSECGAAFGYKRGLSRHERKVHKRPKGLGKPKATYLRLQEEGLLQPLDSTQKKQKHLKH